MNMPLQELERLISRSLDREATVDEQRRLRAALAEPAARALYDEYAAIDAEAGRALRAVLGGGPLRLVRPRACLGWRRWAGSLAIAAGLTGMFWLTPMDGPADGRGGASKAQTSGLPWFVPPRPPADRVEPPKPVADRPTIQLSNTQREWLVVPGKRPGEFLVIEVDRTNTEQIPLHRDF